MIGLFLPTLRAGGAERSVVRLAGAFAAAGEQVELIAAWATGPLLDEVDPRVRVVDLGCRRVLGAVAPLAGYLRTRRPETLIAAMSHANVVAVTARGLSRTPTRLLLHECSTVSRRAREPESWKDRVLPRAVRLAYPYADAVIAVSQGVAEDLRQVVGPRLRVRTIPVPAITPALLDCLRLPPPHPWLTGGGPPVVLGAGRLEPVKGFDTLLRAFGRLRRLRPARLVVVGEGGQRGRLEEEARRLGVQEHVLLPGWVPAPGAWIARADVFALPSRREGMPTALIEALALGRRLVAADCQSGPREVLEGGRWGRLVRVGDDAGLAAALAGALDAPQRPVSAEAWADYSVDAVAQRWLTELRGQRAGGRDVG